MRHERLEMSEDKSKRYEKIDFLGEGQVTFVICICYIFSDFTKLFVVLVTVNGDVVKSLWAITPGSWEIYHLLLFHFCQFGGL